MQDDEEKPVNPPHNKPIRERPDITKIRLYWHHKRSDSLELYYDMYPQDRPIERETKPRGRGR